MANRKPMAGFTSLRSALEAQMARGLDWREAARVVAVARGRPAGDKATYNYANAIVRDAGRVEGRLRLSRETYAGLLSAADQREVEPFELARRLIEAAVAGNLIDAILDDGEDA